MIPPITLSLFTIRDKELDTWVAYRSADATNARGQKPFMTTIMEPPTVSLISLTSPKFSRTKECQEFLEDEKRGLGRKLANCSQAERACVYTAIASIEDWLDLHSSALENIKTAVKLNGSNPEYLWLKAKLSRQQKAFEVQEEMMKKWKQGLTVFPPVGEVQRISSKNWSARDIKDQFVKKGIPVIVKDVVCTMTQMRWHLDYIKERAGSITVPVKRHISGSVEWAKLEESRTTTLADHIDKVQQNQTTDYLFDWSLPLHCPQLANEITVPEYFSGEMEDKVCLAGRVNESDVAVLTFKGIAVLKKTFF
ncbi:bifunctional arginine demethylase and lysyl-hydroxylase JMJD6-B [Elysia marginata]|uniref:Bifunctional arginine demethylase and lysyl-hydroxylase JMJD6-B n=1 Tax=Elysia marginata TaxID=1093978 RepID=A0AAV4GQP9_9GAST|nr:bifunctional arginine demethylase and lysyl-hydroxylase JMJD6-B [Elysia marginata]